MQWKIIPTFPDYEVSEYGNVRRVIGARGGKVGYQLKPYLREDGYDMFIIRKDGKSWHKKAHQLVADAFLPPKGQGKTEIRHIDGTRNNNHYSNLAWATSAENKADMLKHRTRLMGQTHPKSKLTHEMVEKIRSRYKNGELQRILAVEYGIGQVQVSRIVNRKRWQ